MTPEVTDLALESKNPVKTWIREQEADPLEGSTANDGADPSETAADDEAERGAFASEMAADDEAKLSETIATKENCAPPATASPPTKTSPTKGELSPPAKEDKPAPAPAEGTLSIRVGISTPSRARGKATTPLRKGKRWSNEKKVNVALPVVVGMLPDSFSPSFFSLVRNHLWQLAQVQEKKA